MAVYNTPVQVVAPEKNAGGVVDIYCKVDGVDGESQDAKHTGWIEVQSIAGGVANAGAFAYGGGGGSGKSQWQDLTVRCRFDKCYPTLMQKCASGEHIANVTISACKSGGEQQEFLKITMQDVLISSLSMSGAESTEPIFDCGFNFSKIVVTGTGQTNQGTMGASTVAGWDVKQNQKI